MRIAFDIRKLNDFGIGTYIHNLILNLASLDQSNQYLLIAYPEEKEEFPALPDNFAFLCNHTRSVSLWNQWRLACDLRRNAVELLHTPHYQVSSFLPCKSVITIHDCVHILFPNYAQSRAVYEKSRKNTRQAIQKSSHILTVSETTRRDLMRLFHIPEGKVTVVYNAIDERTIRDNNHEEQKRLLERYQIQDPFLLYAGNIRPHKNIARLIEAFSVLKSELRSDDNWKSLKLLIIGDELSKHQVLRRTVARSGVQHDVRFLGFVPSDTLKVFYQTAQMFVFPSLYEGFGLPPLEAMANGTPVLTSNVSSLPEVVGDAALLVNPENVFEIAREMKHLLYDTLLRQELIKKGDVQVRKYSWRKAAELVLEIYRKVLLEPASPTPAI
jgi:glycosyltransferase involved in cell wall biosynthesis